MDGNLILGWVTTVLSFLIAITLFTAKTSYFLTSSNYKLNGKDPNTRLNKVIGVGFTGIGLITLIYCLYNLELPNSLAWLVPGGYLIPVGIMLVLGVVVMRKK